MHSTLPRPHQRCLLHTKKLNENSLCQKDFMCKKNNLSDEMNWSHLSFLNVISDCYFLIFLTKFFMNMSRDCAL